MGHSFVHVFIVDFYILEKVTRIVLVENDGQHVFDFFVSWSIDDGLFHFALLCGHCVSFLFGLLIFLFLNFLGLCFFDGSKKFLAFSRVVVAAHVIYFHDGHECGGHLIVEDCVEDFLFLFELGVVLRDWTFI